MNVAASTLNFHHLRYFWLVAREGSVTRAAKELRVSASALSTQIRQLEAQLGQPLFARVGRGLELTEAGTLALGYADEIFAAGTELLSTLQEGRKRRQVLRVGAVATLSRNFQESFVRPLLSRPNVRLRLGAGSADELLGQLAEHRLDVVLANQPAASASGSPAAPRAFRSRLLARQPVSVVSSAASPPLRFPRDLEGRRLILPGPDSALRGEFEALRERAGLRVRVVAEVDDMAMMRLLVRDTDALALLPTVVVRDELRDGRVHELCAVPELTESFYAVTVARRFHHPLVRTLLERDASELLAVV